MAVQDQLKRPRSNREMRALAFLEGDWDLVLEAASSAGDSPERIATGRAKLFPVLGKRFLEWSTVMTVGGQELASRGQLGFDQALERYEFLWASELSGAQRLARGRGNPLREGLLLEYLDSDVLTGAQSRLQTFMQVLDPDHFVLEQRAHDSATDSWFATLRTLYTRTGESLAQ